MRAGHTEVVVPLPGARQVPRRYPEFGGGVTEFDVRPHLGGDGGGWAEGQPVVHLVTGAEPGGDFLGGGQVIAGGGGVPGSGSHISRAQVHEAVDGQRGRGG
ncbi:MAG: hypothetical protein ACT4NY_11025 [Pseudonocardiales bacterium]